MNELLLQIKSYPGFESGFKISKMKMFKIISNFKMLKIISAFEMFEIHAGRHCPQAKPFFNCIHIESKLDSMARSIKLDSVGTSL